MEEINAKTRTFPFHRSYWGSHVFCIIAHNCILHCIMGRDTYSLLLLAADNIFTTPWSRTILANQKWPFLRGSKFECEAPKIRREFCFFSPISCVYSAICWSTGDNMVVSILCMHSYINCKHRWTEDCNNVLARKAKSHKNFIFNIEFWTNIFALFSSIEL